MLVRLVLAISLPVLMCACTQEADRISSSPTAPSSASPSAASATALAASHVSRVEGNVAVSIMDACDPDSFNAVLGAGTCTRSGGVKFDQFIELLTRHQSVGAWHFAPVNANFVVGQRLLAVNRGGEAHTFTEVEEFGGGIVPNLNQLAGTTTVAPECLALSGSDFIAPGGTFQTDAEDEEGVEHYQCCIHPWMRLDARVRDK